MNMENNKKERTIEEYITDMDAALSELRDGNILADVFNIAKKYDLMYSDLFLCLHLKYGGKEFIAHIMEEILDTNNNVIGSRYHNFTMDNLTYDGE